MTISTILKAAQASDFLAAVPALLGFQPSESVVLVPFRGQRTTGALRIDPPHHRGCRRCGGFRRRSAVQDRRR